MTGAKPEAKAGCGYTVPDICIKNGRLSCMNTADEKCIPSTGIPKRVRRHLCNRRLPGLPYFRKRVGRTDHCRMLGALSPQIWWSFEADFQTISKREEVAASLLKFQLAKVECMGVGASVVAKNSCWPVLCTKNRQGGGDGSSSSNLTFMLESL